MKSWMVGLIMVSLLLVGLGGAEAQHKAGHEKQAAAAVLPEGEQRLVRRLSDFLDFPQEDIIALKERGLGWGDIEMSVLIARNASVPLETVVVEWETSGRQWPAIGQRFGIVDVEVLKGERPQEAQESDPPSDATP